MTAAIEINYFPSQAFFHLLACHNLYIEHCENYQKRSFRNKCIITGVQGPKVLTVPLVKGKHQNQNIKDVKISYAEDWPHQHLQTIISSYGRAPFFDHYIDEIRKLFEARETHLFAFNLKIIEVLQKLIGITKPFEFTKAYLEQSQYDIDLRNKLNSKNYSFVFRSDKYVQVFADRFDFIRNLSVLDLLFCLGPASLLHLEQIELDINQISKKNHTHD